MFGYTISEKQLPIGRGSMPKGSIHLHSCAPVPDQPVSFLGGISPLLVAQPKPSLTDRDTSVAGCLHRVLLDINFNLELIKEISQYAETYVKKFDPIPNDADLSAETWLPQTDYTLKRQQQLLEISRKLVKLRPRDMACKSFIKDEFYEEYKHARTINSRTDKFKVFVGPACKMMEKIVFNSPHFIKYIPVSDRAKWVKDRLSTFTKFLSTDFSSFEASFTVALMEAIEMHLYKRLLQNHPEIYQVLHDALCSENELVFREYTATVLGKRMSGEMTTSLGNGFTNLILMSFVMEKLGYEWDGVFEGDDGLLGVPDTASEDKVNQILSQLGLIIKIKPFNSLNHVSFCGLVFDDESYIVLTDPYDFIVRFGWLSRKYLNARDNTIKSLLRAKAYSGFYQFKQCPIIYVLCYQVLKLTSGYQLKIERDWKVHTIEEAVRNKIDVRTLEDIPDSARVLMDEVYGISIPVQKRFEAYFLQMRDLKPIDDAYIINVIADDRPLWYQHYIDYVQTTAEFSRSDVPNPDFIRNLKAVLK